MSDSQSTPTIQYVLVYPRNTTRARYYVNNNLRDAHAMRYDDLYRWLCEHVTPPTTVNIAEYLRTFQPFVVDVASNAVLLLKPDHEEQLKELALKSRQIDFDAVYDEAVKIYERVHDSDPIAQGSLAAQHRKKTEDEQVPNDNQIKDMIDRNL